MDRHGPGTVGSGKAPGEDGLRGAIFIEVGKGDRVDLAAIAALIEDTDPFLIDVVEDVDTDRAVIGGLCVEDQRFGLLVAVDVIEDICAPVVALRGELELVFGPGAHGPFEGLLELPVLAVGVRWTQDFLRRMEPRHDEEERTEEQDHRNGDE